jgi:hypothetical protein
MGARPTLNTKRGFEMDGLIRVFTNTQRGAPQLSGTAGTLLGVLRACLLDGYGAVSATSVTVAGGIATVQLPQGNSFDAGTVVRISGATPASLNGDARVLTSASAQITLATDAPDGPASGAITVKMAPADWQERFANTVSNVGIFAPTAVEATGMLLRVDDSATTNARVRGWETMQDAGAGAGPIPTDTQVSGGLWWPKSSAANATGMVWWLVADARGLYLAVDPANSGRLTLLYAGDIASYMSGDAWGWLLTGNQADQTYTNANPDGCCGVSFRNTTRGGAYLARLHTGIQGAALAQRIGAHHNGTADAWAGTPNYSWGSYPNSANNGLMTGALELYTNNVLRGALPGLLHPFQDCGALFASGVHIDGTDDCAGRSLLGLRVGAPYPGYSCGTVFIDATGPWSR